MCSKIDENKGVDLPLQFLFLLFRHQTFPDMAYLLEQGMIKLDWSHTTDVAISLKRELTEFKVSVDIEII